MKHNQKGFSVVEVLIILVIVGVIGGAGWFVWQSKNKDKDDTATKTSQTTTQTNETKKKEPESPKYTAYKSDELGVALSYPAEWGTANMADGPLSKAQSGHYKQLSFSKATNVSVNFVTGVYSSPLDACGYDNPVQDAQHGQNSVQASVIGWEGDNIKRYINRQGSEGPAIYKANSTPGDTGEGWTKISSADKLLVYRAIDKPENHVKAGDGNGCSPISQAQADAANAYFSFYHYAYNYSNSKVLGVNGQFDGRKGDDATTRNQLANVLNSIK